MQPKTTGKTVTEVVEEEGVTDSIGADGIDADSVSSDSLLATLDEVSESFNVAGFKCPECGLAHSHSTTKHQVSKSFDISSEEAASGMEYNPVCHCGVHELSHRGSDFGVDEDSASGTARSAPIAPSEKAEMRSRFS